MLLEIIEKIGACWAGLNSAIYLLHISACLGMDEQFEKAKNYLCNFGTLCSTSIYTPPSAVSVMEGKFSDYFQGGDKVEIPSQTEFTSICKRKYGGKSNNLPNIALRALDDDSYMYEWSNDILDALWSVNYSAM
ncbi:MAG: hypothetical protein ACR65R_09385 [Methylomicrobium sp.]